MGRTSARPRTLGRPRPRAGRPPPQGVPHLAADPTADRLTRPALAVVGAGPRGTSVLERICASAAELAPGARLTVHVIDPAPPGAGQVWRTAQPPELLMNTVASQVTLFTDDSVECAGPIRTGPSLYAGRGARSARTTIRGARCTAAIWSGSSGHTVRTAPEEVTVVTHRPAPCGWPRPPDGSQSLTLDDGRTLAGLGAVVLAQGHLPTVAGPGTAAPRRLRRRARPALSAARQPRRPHRRPGGARPGPPGAAARSRPQLLRPHGAADDGARRPVRTRRATAR